MVSKPVSVAVVSFVSAVNIPPATMISPCARIDGRGPLRGCLSFPIASPQYKHGRVCKTVSTRVAVVVGFI